MISRYKSTLPLSIFLFILLSSNIAHACCKCGTIPGKINRNTDVWIGEPNGTDLSGRYVQDFFLGTFFNDHVKEAMKDMTDQFSSTTTAQNNAIGMIHDGKNTQRTTNALQKYKAKTTTNNKPSPQVCTVGSIRQGQFANKQAGKLAAANFSAASRDESVGKQGMPGDEGTGEYKRNMIVNLQQNNTDPSDEGGAASVFAGDSVQDKNYNADLPSATLMQNASDINDDGSYSDDEKNFTLQKKLIFSEPPNSIPSSQLAKPEGQQHYLNNQRIISQRNLISGTWDQTAADRTPGTGMNVEYVKKMLAEEGMDQQEIDRAIGNGSSHATLETMSFYQPQSSAAKIGLIASEDDVDRQMLAAEGTRQVLNDKLYRHLESSNLILGVYANQMNRRAVADKYNDSLNNIGMGNSMRRN